MVQKKREDPLESSPILCALKGLKICRWELSYWPEAAVLAVAAPAPFGMLK
jgi:hypothetical protein